MDYGRVAAMISDFISMQVRGRGAVLGLSGGVDSAVVASLSEKALGKDRVKALILPDDECTPEGDTEDAISLAKELGIQHEVINITGVTRAFFDAMRKAGSRVSEGNVRARIRMTALYYVANEEGRIVIGSGDRSELLLGYFTKYGDGGADILPIGGLYKSQVIGMAKWLGVPPKIVNKRSSPRLWRDQLAEEELGMPYSRIDAILYAICDLRLSVDEVVKALGEGSQKDVISLVERIERNRHKLSAPPIAKITD